MKFYRASDALSISTPDFEVAVPTDQLLSIQVTGSSAEVTYNWRGQPITVSGELQGEITGKSDFGDFKLSAAKVRQLSFSSPPNPTKANRPSLAVSVVVTLKSGKRMTLSSFQRHHSFYSTEGYILGGSTRYHHLTDFRFQRGESLATLKFDAIRKLEFGDGNTVTVILMNGTSGSGGLSTANDAGVSGWTGESEYGNVFIHPNVVQAIEFTDASNSGAGKR